MTGLEYFYLLIASFVISLAMTPKITSQKPAAFEDIEFPQAAEGTPQAVFFGDCWSGDWTVLAVGDYRTRPILASDAKK